jgi:ABC-type transport system involved in cytochrome c biogenesis permease subunit
MAIDALQDQESEDVAGNAAAELEAEFRARQRSPQALPVRLLLPLASLRLTVALFAMAIFLVFAGTLAQVDQDIWEVMQQYFRTVFAWIPLQVFFPPAFFTSEPPEVPGGFWFPGGFLIGALMGVNLLAAHAVRFKVQARGARLMWGLAVLGVGCALTWLVIVGGSGKDTIEGAAPFAWSALWTAMKWSLVALWLAGAYALVRLDRSRRLERWGLIAGGVGLTALVTWIFAQGDAAALGDSSMRILWQLIKGGLAGLVLLAGCWLVFYKRAGIVLLHAGVALVMANELVVFGLHKEGQMRIREGQTVDHVFDIRSVELAIVDPSHPKTDDVVVVPQSRLTVGERIHDAALPFDVQVLEYFKNARLVKPQSHDKNPATAGAGLQWIAQEIRPGSGTDTGGEVDLAAAYLQLFDKQSHQPLGTYLVSLDLIRPDDLEPMPQKVQVGDKAYDVALRFKRTYKPYAMRLHDVRFDKYMGTQTAKNYSSDLHLADPSRNVDRDVKIWMNNPLRFAGETFYQQNYQVDQHGNEMTTLQVVTNTGWMIPYVACMLVGTGMLAQFSITLVRFLKRRDTDLAAEAAAPARKRRPERAAAQAASTRDTTSLVFAALVVLAGAGWVLSSARVPNKPQDQLQIDEFGRLPLVYEGRVKPFDTLARNSLRQLSDKQTFTDETGSEPVRSQPAMKWLLDVISGSPDAFKHKVFRIENLDVMQTLGLERRKGLIYALDEFRDKIGEFEHQAELAAKTEREDPRKLSTYQKKLLELDKKLRLFMLLVESFHQPEIRHDHVQEDLSEAIRRHQSLARFQPPLVVPPVSKDAQWEPYSVAYTKAFAQANILNQEPNAAAVAMNAMLAAYHNHDAKAFNAALARYETTLAERSPEGYHPAKTNFEAFFNYFEPFYRALVLYLVAFVLVVIGWLGWSKPLNRAAFWLVVFTFALHTFALVARIYISGRPPVTNLYSSAVFIGWGAVLLGIVMEAIYRIGIGTVIAAVAGFSTLIIAHNLAAGGDTFIVLQAVLDTQFWLATHVTCITLGYATTLVAGFLGLLYIVRGVLTPSLSPQTGKELTRMIYGTLCFALFFSFIGTVLGGLWADDSWGRFWGWDPKENGALIIVLWNALVLHARWGAIVKQRGLAALAVVGNIVVGWSWFGVNELGVGLHSYGFTEGVLRTLAIFIATQLAAIALAALPARYWWSQRAAA